MIVVDRIEGGRVLCDADGMIIDLPLEKFRKAVKEGDVLILTDDGYSVNQEETAKRRIDMAARFARLKKNK